MPTTSTVKGTSHVVATPQLLFFMAPALGPDGAKPPDYFIPLAQEVGMPPAAAGGGEAKEGDIFVGVPAGVAAPNLEGGGTYKDPGSSSVSTKDDPVEWIVSANTEDELLRAIEAVQGASVEGGATMSYADVALTAGEKRKQNPEIWTATVAQAFGQLLKLLQRKEGT